MDSLYNVKIHLQRRKIIDPVKCAQIELGNSVVVKVPLSRQGDNDGCWRPAKQVRKILGQWKYAYLLRIFVKNLIRDKKRTILQSQQHRHIDEGIVR